MPLHFTTYVIKKTADVRSDRKISIYHRKPYTYLQFGFTTSEVEMYYKSHREIAVRWLIFNTWLSICNTILEFN